MNGDEKLEKVRMVNVYFVVRRRKEDIWSLDQIKRGLRILSNLRSNPEIPMNFTKGGPQCLILVEEMDSDNRVIRIPNGAIGKRKP
jgi:hypothetical protein